MRLRDKSNLPQCFSTAQRWDIWLSSMSWKGSVRSAASSSLLYHISPLTGLLSFPPIVLLAALPPSVLLSGKTVAPQRTSAQSRDRKRGLKPSVLSSDSLWCSGKATYRHAAFLYRTLGEPSFMRCSITCILSPDWVALMCKYLRNKAVIWVHIEGHCVVWHKKLTHWNLQLENLPPEKPFF